jgi:hypothetical protein
MHVHLPKPLRGWREFLKEVGIIVLGVLIALGAEQVVESIHWHAKVADARQELRYEVGHNLALMNWRNSMSGCVDRRLDQLSAALNLASRSGRLPPLGAIGSPLGGTFPTAVWQSQVSAETATHFSAVELGSIGRIYRYIEIARDIAMEESRAWRSLNGLVGPGRPADAVTIDRFVDALVAARRFNHMDAFYARQIAKIMVQSGLGRGFAEVDPRNPPVLRGISSDTLCKPIGTDVPPGYGMSAAAS